MSEVPRERIENLLMQDQEFQELAREHSEYEAQLEQLSKTSYLNLEDLQREIALKKLKLRVKDAMERRIAQRIHQATGR